MNLHELLSDKSSDVGLMPFWCWNGPLEERDLLWQLAQIKQQGVKRFLIAPRPGLQLDSQGGDWVEWVARAVREARRLGLEVWLCGDLPEARVPRLLLAAWQDVEEGARLELDLPAPADLVAVIAFPLDAGGQPSRYPEGVTDLTRRAAETHLSWTPPPGRWRVMAFGCDRSAAPDAQALPRPRFLLENGEAFFSRMGTLLGRSLNGFYVPTNGDVPAAGIPWAPPLAAEFQRRMGYSVLRVLPALFDEVGPNTGSLRHEFYEFLAQVAAEAYNESMGRWCRNSRLRLVSAPAESGNLAAQLTQPSDSFRLQDLCSYASARIDPDVLWPLSESGVVVPNALIELKLASSAADLLGKEHVLADSAGARSGWATTFAEQRRALHWQAALGVDLYASPRFFYSIAGFRKWEQPPSSFYQSSGWPEYGGWVEYAERLGRLVAHSRHVSGIAILYPTHAVWSHQEPSNPAPLSDMQRSLAWVSERILRHQRDFDYVTEELLGKAHGRNGKMVIGEESFSVLILPCVRDVQPRTAASLAYLVGAGLEVVFIGPRPESLAGLPGHDLPWGSGSVRSHGAALLGLLDSLAEPDIRVSDAAGKALPDLLCRHGQGDDWESYLIVNTSAEDACQAQVRLRGADRAVVESWDLETGESALCPVGPGGEWPLVLAPGEARVLLVSPASTRGSTPQPGALPRQAPATWEPLPLPERWAFTPEGLNALPLAQWTLSIEERGTAGPHALSYRAGFNVAERPLKLALVVDDLAYSRAVRFRLNGQSLGELRPADLVDHYWRQVDLTALVREGGNELLIESLAEGGPPFSLSDAVYLMGDFELAARQGDRFLTRPRPLKPVGSWTEEGYPFYSGRALYEATIMLDEAQAGQPLRLALGQVLGHAQVRVNGELVASRLWPPFEADLTGKLRAGENRLGVTIVNSLANLFCRESRRSGWLGPAELWIGS